MLGLYQNATGSMPSLRRGSMQLREQGAQQVCSNTAFHIKRASFGSKMESV